MAKRSANGHHRIVVTGGPGGGKTTAADLFRRELGECIVIVPEAATLLFNGGFLRPTHNQNAVQSSQMAIYHVQTNNEDIHAALYPHRTLLCDRGTLDGAAYWPDGDESFFKAINSTIEEELERYDAVIFFETAAIGGMSIEGGNPARTESLKEAIELDKKLKEVWSKHPNFQLVAHNKSFVKKINNGLYCLQDSLDRLEHRK